MKRIAPLDALRRLRESRARKQARRARPAQEVYGGLSFAARAPRLGHVPIVTRHEGDFVPALAQHPAQIEHRADRASDFEVDLR
jgi:hypothetical protein